MADDVARVVERFAPDARAVVGMSLGGRHVDRPGHPPSGPRPPPGAGRHHPGGEQRQDIRHRRLPVRARDVRQLRRDPAADHRVQSDALGVVAAPRRPPQLGATARRHLGVAPPGRVGRRPTPGSMSSGPTSRPCGTLWPHCPCPCCWPGAAGRRWWTTTTSPSSAGAGPVTGWSWSRTPGTASRATDRWNWRRSSGSSLAGSDQFISNAPEVRVAITPSSLSVQLAWVRSRTSAVPPPTVAVPADGYDELEGQDTCDQPSPPPPPSEHAGPCRSSPSDWPEPPCCPPAAPPLRRRPPRRRPRPVAPWPRTTPPTWPPTSRRRAARSTPRVRRSSNPSSARRSTSTPA